MERFRAKFGLKILKKHAQALSKPAVVRELSHSVAPDVDSIDDLSKDQIRKINELLGEQPPLWFLKK